MKSVKGSGVIIKCKNKADVEKIKKVSEKKMKKRYDIKLPEQRNPCIKVSDIEEDIKEEVLKISIIKQNFCLQDGNFDVTVGVIKKMKSKFMAILEVDSFSFLDITTNEKICTRWTLCRVYKYVRDFGQFKCAGFDNKAEERNTGTRCKNCIKSNHVVEYCKSEVSVCGNCVQANIEYKNKLKTGHSIFDLKHHGLTALLSQY